MDFDNITELLNGMTDYYKTHSINDADLLAYDALELTDDPDPRLKALLDKDKFGEYIGIVTRSWCPAGAPLSYPGMPKVNNITVYMRPDLRPAGVWNNIGNITDSYEIFDYHDGYFTSARFSFLMNQEMHQNFAYYVQNGEGRVEEIISIYGGMISLNGNYVNLTRIVLDYNGDETILVSSNDYRYKKSGDGYVLEESSDNTSERDEDDIVIDDQQELCEELIRKINKDMSLEEITRTFFEVIATAEHNPDEMLEYAAGTFPLSFPGSEPLCVFTLVRQTPDGEDEYYQLAVDITFDTDGDIPYDHMWHEEGDDDLLEFILNSESYKAFKDKRITDIDIRVDQT